MIIDIEGKKVDVAIYLDEKFTSLRYEITCDKEIHPLESAFILMLIARGICSEAGADPAIVMAEYAMAPENEEVH